DESNTAQLLESLKQLPPPPPVETPTEVVDDAATETTDAKTEAPKASTPSKGGGGGPSPTKGGGGGSVSDAQAAAISNELNQLNVEMLAALNASGSSTDRVLQGGDVPTGLLDSAAASSQGVGSNG